MTRHFGLIGFPLTHSFSKQFFDNKFFQESMDATYELFPINDQSILPQFLDGNLDLDGFNVTIPYKKIIIPFLDDIDQVALDIGAVNVVKRIGNRWKGFNTDWIGFAQSLKPNLKTEKMDALVLGTGGAAKAICYALRFMDIDYKMVSRTPSEHHITYDELSKEIIDRYKLIINTTPIGMYPDIKMCPPIPYHFIGDHHILYDLIYNPDETTFLANGIERGASAINGYEMLVIQAEESWKIWTNY